MSDSDAPDSEPPRTGTLPVRLAPRVSYGPGQRSASGRATNRTSTSSLWRHTGGHLLLKRRRLGMSLHALRVGDRFPGSRHVSVHTSWCAYPHSTQRAVPDYGGITPEFGSFNTSAALLRTGLPSFRQGSIPRPSYQEALMFKSCLLRVCEWALIRLRAATLTSKRHMRGRAYGKPCN